MTGVASRFREAVLRLVAGRWLLVLLLPIAPGAHAAESYANCSGYIDAVPASIATAGTWCLRHDLSTSIASGVAISINASNVTLDCNGYKLGGLGAGIATDTDGVTTNGGALYNLAVRNCTIRGFRYGIFMISGSGNGGNIVIEDNLLDHNTRSGAYINGGGSVMRRNRVFATGGKPGVDYVIALTGKADFIDNVIDGVHGDPTLAVTDAVGIHGQQFGACIQGNRISGLLATGGGYVFGIQADGFGIVSNNRIAATTPATPGAGIFGDTYFQGQCAQNSIANIATALYYCDDWGGNVKH